ncbi:DUF4317 family protein [Murimonas intestini]|uniref:Uncharacterized protein DUF4317 n=1 Tax=Murimonas intestini TaxID=1337051 RepID=A0AB73T524_9FIRM|nr:DUF4317 family protein [Murimonas intestini]MCR1840662.1 DUF4317 domain-containing protein [Murimonas intestini]MCR1865285.1 DUF4317 domain-containing protein [Murimonas intestini]MCR1883004.1 DUF4317 domain-containing protein [Murimonas intestini]
MINREDMMELTRRMTPARTSMTRIAGSYMDADGEIDGTFNTNFLKLSAAEKSKKLAVAKAIPFSGTNENLKRYKFPKDSMKQGSMWHLLMCMKSCGLKNDALMDTFYELVSELYQVKHDYAVFVFHDRYDVPVKGADHERLGESEEVYEYIICAICPLSGEYEPGKPECGFIFPAFADRSAEQNYVDVFQSDAGHPHLEILKILGV